MKTLMELYEQRNQLAAVLAKQQKIADVAYSEVLFALDIKEAYSAYYPGQAPDENYTRLSKSVGQYITYHEIAVDKVGATRIALLDVELEIDIG